MQELVCVRGCRAVRAFGDDLGPNLRRVVDRDLVFEGSRNQHVNIKSPQLVVRQRLGTGITMHRFFMRGGVLEQFGDVQSPGVIDAAFPIGDRDDLRSGLRQQIG